MQAIVADQKAIDLYHFTHLLNGQLDDNGRLRVIEMMWQLAYADGAVSDYEDNLIWRVADLLGVSSPERIALRQRAAARRGDMWWGRCAASERSPHLRSPHSVPALTCRRWTLIGFIATCACRRWNWLGQPAPPAILR